MTAQKFLVAHIINNRRVIVNAGANVGIKKGMHCTIYEEGEEIFDPATQESLGPFENIKGLARVVQVDEKKSIVESYKFKQSSFSVLAKSFQYVTNPEDNYLTQDFSEPIYIGDLVRFG